MLEREFVLHMSRLCNTLSKINKMRKWGRVEGTLKLVEAGRDKDKEKDKVRETESKMTTMSPFPRNHKPS